MHRHLFPLIEDPASAARGLVLRCYCATVPVVENQSASATSLQVGPGALTFGKMQAAAFHMGSMPGLIQTTKISSKTININSAFSYSPGPKYLLRKGHGAAPLSSVSSWSDSRPRNLTTDLACRATSAVHFTEKFDATGLERWQIARKHVEELGFSSEEADDVLAKSFGWSYSDYWGEEKQATIPDPETVSNSFSLMKDLGLDLSTLLKKFPELVGLTDREIQSSLATLDSKWGIAGKNLKNVLNRNPQVLGYNIDCQGDCAGECTRCWVRF